MLIFFEKISEEKAIVRAVHYIYNEQQKTENSLEVDAIPESSYIMGKRPVLYVNPVTKTLWYEYEDRPLTTEEELQQLKERQALMQQALDDLLLGGM